jgi:DHA2 family multidrug resistance protein
VLLTSLLIFDPPYLVRKTFRDGLRMDYVGLALLVLGLGFLEITLDEGQRNDWFGSQFILASAIIAAFSLVGVVIWELRQSQPIIDFRALKERNFAVATISMLMLGFVLYGSTTLLPLLLQTLLGYSAMQSGLVLSPGGLVILAGMPLVGFLLKKVEPRWLIAFGVIVCSLGLFHMAGFSLDIDFRTAVNARMVQSLGLAFLFVPINTTAFSGIAKDRTSYASGLINLARNIGGSSGIAIATTILARRSQYHQQVLVAHATPLDSGFMATLSHLAAILQSQGSSAVDAFAQAQRLAYGMIQRQASMLAFADAFWILGGAFLAILPLLLVMKRTAPHSGPMVME